MKHIVNGELIEMTDEEKNSFLEDQESYALIDPMPYQLYKSVFIDRLTDEEAEIMEIVLQTVSPKLRMKFNSVEYFLSNDPLFDDLKDAISVALDEERAEELLKE